jgi:hypothetical protein
VFGAGRNVYTLTAEGSTDGFERGYDASLGDLFDLGVVTNNPSVTITLADGAAAPELSTWAMVLIGSWVLSLRAVVCRARALRSQRGSLENTAREATIPRRPQTASRRPSTGASEPLSGTGMSSERWAVDRRVQRVAAHHWKPEHRRSRPFASLYKPACLPK